MDERRALSRHDAESRRRLRSGQPYRFEVKLHYRGHMLEMADVYFHHDSAVLMPCSERDEEDEGSAGGLSVLAACYCHADQHPLQQLIVVGHTDTSGREAYNLELSRLRAENALAALRGDRERWVQIAVQQHQVEDCQQILKCIVRAWNWDCDPGPVDNRYGSQTRSAVRRFQAHYNDIFEASISVDGVVGEQTWGAYFDVYMRMLAEILQADETDLVAFRRKLSFLDGAPPAIGCGEHHPVEQARKDDYQSQTNRRVEFLFFDPEERPLLECHRRGQPCKPGVCDLYSGTAYQFEPIPVEVFPLGEQDKFIRIVNELGEPVADRRVTVHVEDGRELTLVTDSEGKIYPHLREGKKVQVELHEVHEMHPADSATTASGQHFAAGEGGPAEEASG